MLDIRHCHIEGSRTRWYHRIGARDQMLGTARNGQEFRASTSDTCSSTKKATCETISDLLTRDRSDLSRAIAICIRLLPSCR